MNIRNRTICFLLLLLSFSWVIFYASNDVDDLVIHYFQTKTSKVDKNKIKEIFENSIVPLITKADIEQIPIYTLPPEERMPLFRYMWFLYVQSAEKDYILLQSIIKITAKIFKLTIYNPYKQVITYPEYVGHVTFFSTAISFIVTLLVLFMVLQTHISQRGIYILTLTFVATILGSFVWIFLKSLDLAIYLQIPPLNYFSEIMFGSLNQNYEPYVWAPRGHVFILVALVYLLLLSYKKNFIIIILLTSFMFLNHFAQAFVAIVFLISSEIFNGIFTYFRHLFLKRQMTDNFFKLSYFSIPFIFNILAISGLTLLLYYTINWGIKEIAFLDILISIFKNSKVYTGLIFSYIFFTILYTDNIIHNKLSSLFEIDQPNQWMKGLKLTSFIIFFIIYAFIFNEVFVHYRGTSRSSTNILFPFFYSAPQVGARTFNTFIFILRLQIITFIFFLILRKKNKFIDIFNSFYGRIITSKKMAWIVCAMCMFVIFMGYNRLTLVNRNMTKSYNKGGKFLNPTWEEATILFMASKFEHKWFADDYKSIYYYHNDYPGDHRISREVYTGHIYGYYGEEDWSEGKVRWMGKRSLREIEVKSSVLNINLFCGHPDVQKMPVRADLWIDNNYVGGVTFIRNGWKDVNIHLSPEKGKKVKLKIEVNRTFNPHKWGINNDRRDLGLASLELPEDRIGFYDWETWNNQFRFRWTKKRASMHLEARSDMFEIPILALHPDIKKNPVTVKIYWDDLLLEEVTFNQNRWIKVKLNLQEVSKGNGIITFDVSRTWNPKIFKVSEDNRDLGVAVGEPKY